MLQPATYSEEQEHTNDHPGKKRKFVSFFSSLFLNWEILLILLASLFFRLVNLNTTIFSSDEADVFRMAHDAIISGWLPLTSNRASLGNLNPSLVVYVFMLPAALSANPLWGQVLVALFNSAAILLTYFFVRRYYGRLAGTIAALLYATSAGAWTFSRNIWPQNFLPFFILLFLFVLFRGVIEKRKGWFFWAIVLLGILYQFHGSSLYLLIPLAAAVVFAFKTLRWRDLFLGIIALLVLFLPYIVWEIHVDFTDITMVLATAGAKASLDTQALHFYLFFLHPTILNPYLDAAAKTRDTHLLIPNDQSFLVVSHLNTLLKGVYVLSVLLLLTGILVSIWQVLAPRQLAPAEGASKNVLVRWWQSLLTSPERQGLVLILLWQLVPLLLLTHHSVVLFAHYFIFFVPGQFILIALGATRLVALVRQFRPAWTRLARYGLAALAALVILGQLAGISGAVVDISSGRFTDGTFSDLQDQQKVLQLVDQIAQQRHIQRLYVSFFPSYVSTNSISYLAEQSSTPAEILGSSSNCFALPAPAAGPVLFLTTSGNAVAEQILSQYTDATLVATSPHLPMAPYQIYVLTAKATPAAVPHAFNQGLQLLSSQAQVLRDTATNAQWLFTRWSVTDTHQAAMRAMYNYQIHMTGATFRTTAACSPNRTWAGDQLFALYSQTPGASLPAQVSVQASTSVLRPQTLSIGPLTGFIFYSSPTDTQTLLTEDHKTSFTLSAEN